MVGLILFSAHVGLALHALFSGRGKFWVFFILLVPLVGFLAYLHVVIWPIISEFRIIKIITNAMSAVTGFIGNVLSPQNIAIQKHAAHLRLQKWRAGAAGDLLEQRRIAQENFNYARTVENRIQLAQVMMAGEDYDGVIRTLKPALTKNVFADDVRLFEGLAYASFGKGDFAQALHYIAQIYSRPETPPSYIRHLRAQARIETGDLAAGCADLIALCNVLPDAEIHVQLAQVYERMGKVAEAYAVYQSILSRTDNPDQEKTWIKMAEEGLARTHGA